MAGHDDADWICTVRHADGARGVRQADFSRELSIGGGPARWNAAQCAPNLALECGAAGLDRQTVDRREITVIVRVDRIADRTWHRALGKTDNAVAGILLPQQGSEPAFVII